MVSEMVLRPALHKSSMPGSHSARGPRTIALAADLQLGALLNAALDEAHDLVELLLRHLRPLLRAAVEGVAHHTRLRCRLGALHKLVVDALVHKGARARGAALALHTGMAGREPVSMLGAWCTQRWSSIEHSVHG